MKADIHGHHRYCADEMFRHVAITVRDTFKLSKDEGRLTPPPEQDLLDLTAQNDGICIFTVLGIFQSITLFYFRIICNRSYQSLILDALCTEISTSQYRHFFLCWLLMFFL